ncbi:MAG: DUF58 domain-containing protein [Verrucomicrobiae bacterium]|nr:DUF58 domain-containing protein [Verrucomicrobiae bacterium]
MAQAQVASRRDKKQKILNTRIAGRGAVLLVAGLTAIATGLATSDPIVTQFGLLFLVVTSGSYFVCRHNLRGLLVHRTAPDCVVASDDFRITVTVTNSRRWLDAFALELEDAALPFWRKGMLVRQLRCGESADLSETTRMVTRGDFPSKSCKLRSTFPFGLFRSELRLRPSLGILVFPRPELPKRLRQQLETQLFEGENIARYERDSSGEFHGIRPFQPGDRCRSIHWPATARRRTLMVREWDRPQPEKFSVVFHSFFPAGKPVLPEGFDHAMELLSGLLFHCRDLQIPMQLIASFADWKPIDLPDPQELKSMLALLARARMRAEHSPQPLIDAIEGIPGHHRIYIISNVPLKYWSKELPDLPHPVVCLDNRELRLRRPRLLNVRPSEEFRNAPPSP